MSLPYRTLSHVLAKHTAILLSSTAAREWRKVWGMRMGAASVMYKMNIIPMLGLGGLKA